MNRQRFRPLAGLICLAMLVLAGCRQVGEAGPAPPSTAALPAVQTSTGAEMVHVPAGRFRMGSAAGQPDEQPEHDVSLDAFFIDRTEVTQAQYDKLVRGNPSHFKGPDRPTEQISWAAAALYCNLRSRAEGLRPCYDEETARCDFQADGYRLPTEAEWEYACRAGATGDYDFGSDPRELKEHAWYADNAGKTTHPVGQKRPNAWGLYDMQGNVAEWCNDVYDERYYASSPPQNPQGPPEGERYVLRGGAWNCRDRSCRASARVGENPGFQDACFARDAIGFRCVRRPPPDAGSDKTPSTEPTRPKSAEPAKQDADVKRRPAKTGLVYCDAFLEHKTPEGHPEQPERLTTILARLRQTGLLDDLERIDARPAERQWLERVHRAEYLDRVEQSCRQGAGWLDSRDTPICGASYRAAVSAAGGALAAVDAVMAGRVRNAFCALRPPGHHALKDRAMGFCLFNNVAIAARYAQRRHNLERVLIVDWDVHHGNGTQACFDDDPSVFYFSVHRSPFYPGTGGADDEGLGRAKGTKLNVPLPAGSGGEAYRDAFRKLPPAARGFRPQFVLVSAGFDAHQDDPLGGMRLTAEIYGDLTRVVKQIAEESCQGRLVSVLEGGYGAKGLATSVETHLRVLMD